MYLFRSFKHVNYEILATDKSLRHLISCIVYELSCIFMVSHGQGTTSVDIFDLTRSVEMYDVCPHYIRCEISWLIFCVCLLFYL